MAKSGLKDVFSNRTQVEVVMSAANTLTFQQVRFAVGTFQGVALILNRIEMSPAGAAIDEIVAAADNLQMAITTRDDLTAINPTNLSVMYVKNIESPGANVEVFELPLVGDFTGLPGGGLLMPANPIFLAVLTGGFVAAATVRFTLYYQFKELSKDENLELIQTLLPGTV